MKQLLLLIFLFTVAGRPTFAADAQLGTRERDFSEALLDLAALTKDGISRGDLRKAVPDLAVKYDRYVRSGGKEYGILYDAYKSYRDADEIWDQRTKTMFSNYDPDSKAKLAQLYSDRLAQLLGDARSSLDRYREQQRSLLAEQAAKGKKPTSKDSAKKAPPSKSDPSTDAAIREAEQLVEAHKARMEAIRAEDKARQQELDSQRACRYTTPPSCTK